MNSRKEKFFEVMAWIVTASLAVIIASIAILIARVALQ